MGETAAPAQPIPRPGHDEGSRKGHRHRRGGRRRKAGCLRRQGDLRRRGAAFLFRPGDGGGSRVYIIEAPQPA